MNEPQVWTLIGVFAATMIGLVTVITQSFTRTLSAKFDAVNARFDAMDSKFDSKFEIVSERIDGLKAEMVLRFDHVDRRLDRLENRVDGLDADVQAISRRVFPE